MVERDVEIQHPLPIYPLIEVAVLPANSRLAIAVRIYLTCDLRQSLPTTISPTLSLKTFQRNSAQAIVGSEKSSFSKALSTQYCWR